MTAFTLRGFATEGMIAAPHLSGHLRAVNGQLTGSIENLSSTTFTDAVVIAGDGFQKLGALPPGARVTVGFVPKITTFNGPPAILSVYPNYSFGPQAGAPTDAQRDGEAKTRILSLLQSGGFKGIQSNSVSPLVVAWTNQSFQAITVNGVHPLARRHDRRGDATAGRRDRRRSAAGRDRGRSHGRLRRRHAVGPARSAQRSDRHRHLPLHATAGARPPPGGSEHLRLQPLLRQGRGGPAGTTSTIRGEAWDWSRSTWVDINYQDSGTTSLPPAVINPATGEIRVRVIVNNGAFLTTGISLAGTAE